MADITIEQAYREAQRELKIRQSFYPRWIEQGTITEPTAAHRLACQEYIVAVLAGLLAETDPQRNLL